MPKKPLTLITGASGQDAPFVAERALAAGEEVICVSSRQNYPSASYHYLRISDKVRWITADVSCLSNFASVFKDLNLHKVFHLSGQSSVSKSFEKPEETFNSQAGSTTAILEFVRMNCPKASIFIASSVDCLASNSSVIDEKSGFSFNSPYAASKVAALSMARGYRESYGLKINIGYLSNHESEFRPAYFVTKKIVEAAYQIRCQKADNLILGDVSTERDWGLADEFMHGAFLLNSVDIGEDVLIATGVTQSLLDFATSAFDFFGLKLDDHLEIDFSLKRISDENRRSLSFDTQKMTGLTGWQASTLGSEVAASLCERYVRLLRVKLPSIA